MAALSHGLSHDSGSSVSLLHTSRHHQHGQRACDPPSFSMAFQPVVDIRNNSIAAYEALVRGKNGEPAATVLKRDLGQDLYSFDQLRRISAIEMAAALGLEASGADLCINFFPNEVHQAAACLDTTLIAAERVGILPRRLIFEINEREQVLHMDHLHSIVLEYRSMGLRTAMDDFGSGFAGLTMLAEFQPDIVKIDMALTHRIYERRASQSIVRAIVEICTDLGIEIIAEGVERREEMEMLQEMGIAQMQGFYLAAPAFEQLPRWNPDSRSIDLSASTPARPKPVRKGKLLPQLGCA